MPTDVTSNLPIGVVAIVVLFFFLRTPQRERKSVREQAADFDFLGLFFIIGGVVMLVLGFSFSEQTWQAARTIVLIALGAVFLIGACVWESQTTRTPIIPPRLFETRTTAFVLLSVFVHGLTFFAAAFYLPLYLQILGHSAIGAGVRMIAFSCTAALVSAIAGVLATKMKSYKELIVGAWVLMVLGYGLLIMLDESTSTAVQEVVFLIPALGIGPLFQLPLLALQAAMPIKFMPQATATYGLVRQIGATLGTAIGAAIYASQLRIRLADLPAFGDSIDTSSANALLGIDLSTLTQIEPPALQQQVLHAFTRSISTIWIVATPLNAVGLVAVLFLRRYSLDRTVNRMAAKDGKAAEGGAGEKAAVEDAKTDEAPSPTRTADEEAPAATK